MHSCGGVGGAVQIVSAGLGKTCGIGHSGLNVSALSLYHCIKNVYVTVYGIRGTKINTYQILMNIGELSITVK